MHPSKELRYFTEQHNLHRGLDWYRRQFAELPPGKAIGEASNAYTRHPIYEIRLSNVSFSIAFEISKKKYKPFTWLKSPRDSNQVINFI